METDAQIAVALGDLAGVTAVPVSKYRFTWVLTDIRKEIGEKDGKIFDS